jgi:hypothetical protein
MYSFKPWDDITVAVGDLPVFSDLLGDGKNPYNVPTVLIGLDILSQRRLYWKVRELEEELEEYLWHHHKRIGGSGKTFN